jgi:hypothetical protein
MKNKNVPFELSELDKRIVEERFEAYKTGKDKGVSAEMVSRNVRAKLKKNN